MKRYLSHEPCLALSRGSFTGAFSLVSVFAQARRFS